jgi:hypothetical protein
VLSDLWLCSVRLFAPGNAPLPQAYHKLALLGRVYAAKTTHLSAAIAKVGVAVQDCEQDLIVL